MQRPCGGEDRLCGEREGLKGLCGTVLPCSFTSEPPKPSCAFCVLTGCGCRHRDE